MQLPIREFDELLIRVDEKASKISTYRMNKKRDELYIFTEYPLDKLAAKPFDEAARMVGEQILIALKSTRERWPELGGEQDSPAK